MVVIFHYNLIILKINQVANVCVFFFVFPIQTDKINEENRPAEELSGSQRITKIITDEFPHYFAIISRVRREVHAVGPDGAIINSTVVPRVQATFTEGALTKRIKVDIQVRILSLINKFISPSLFHHYYCVKYHLLSQLSLLLSLYMQSNLYMLSLY